MFDMFDIWPNDHSHHPWQWDHSRSVKRSHPKSKTYPIVKHEGSIRKSQQNVQTTADKGVSELVTAIPPKREQAKRSEAWHQNGNSTELPSQGPTQHLLQDNALGRSKIYFFRSKTYFFILFFSSDLPSLQPSHYSDNQVDNNVHQMEEKGPPDTSSRGHTQIPNTRNSTRWPHNGLTP